MSRIKPTVSDVIEAVLDNMRESLQPLGTKVLAPSTYEIRLHKSDHQRLRGIRNMTASAVAEALDLELERQNRPSWLSKWFPTPDKIYEADTSSWDISILEDPNDTLRPGDIEVVSSMASEVQPDPEDARPILDRSGGTQNLSESEVFSNTAKPESASEATVKPVRLLIDPGTAPPEVVGDILADLSSIYRKAGGSGIEYRLVYSFETDRILV